MTKSEISEWLKKARYVDTEHFDVDGCDNRWESKIYAKDDKFYRVEFLNNEPVEDYPHVTVNGSRVYSVVEVFHRQETRIVDIYETQEEIDAQTQPQLDVDIDLDENKRAEVSAYINKKYSNGRENESE